MCIRARQLNNIERYLLQHQIMKFQPLRQSKPERRFPLSHPEALEDVILDAHCHCGLCSTVCGSGRAVCTPLPHLLLCARLVLLSKPAAAWVPQEAGSRLGCAQGWAHVRPVLPAGLFHV